MVIEKTSIDPSGWSEELARDRKIIPQQLDVHAVEQADLMCKWAERAAVAGSDLDDIKHQAETVKAKLATRVREMPTKFGLTRDATVAAFEAKVKTLPSYLRAQEELLKIKRIDGFLDVAVSAMEDRRRMLEFLGKLHAQKWFAGPDIPRDLAERWAAHAVRRNAVEEEGVRKMNKRLSRRGRHDQD